MNQKLLQAIQATRAGENKKAQYLLTQTLQEEPENTQAWYLLSLLVDSEEKQAVYLQRVAALDPTHEKAQERLQRLPTAVPIVEPDTTPVAMPVRTASDYTVFGDAPDEDGELPDWMKAGIGEDAGDEADDFLAAMPKMADTPAADIPTWLQEDALSDWSEPVEVKETAVSPAAPVVTETVAISPAELAIAETSKSQVSTPVAKKPAAPNKKNDGALTAVLVILVVLAVIVAAFLVYTLLNI